MEPTIKEVAVKSIMSKSNLPVCDDIYTKRSRQYWQALDHQMKQYAENRGLDYFTNTDDLDRPFDAPPAIVNFFYHEDIKRAARTATQ